jgi:hypothetical protein
MMNMTERPPPVPQPSHNHGSHQHILEPTVPDIKIEIEDTSLTEANSKAVRPSVLNVAYQLNGYESSGSSSPTKSVSYTTIKQDSDELAIKLEAIVNDEGKRVLNE